MLLIENNFIYRFFFHYKQSVLSIITIITQIIFNITKSNANSRITSSLNHTTIIFQQTIIIKTYPPQLQQKQNLFYLDNVISSTKQQARVLNDKKLIWPGSISFAIVYDKQINFQIYNKHKFGFNPEDLENILCGKFKILKNQKYKEIDVFQQGKANEKIGTLHCNIRINSIIPQKIGLIMPKNQKLCIKSIIAHLPNLKQKKTYIDIKVGDQNKQTPFIRSRNGQIVFIQGYQIDKSSYIQSATFDIFALTQKNNSTKLVASGILPLQDEFPPRMFKLYDAKGDQMGEVFIECKQKGKRMDKQQAISSVQKTKHTLEPSQITRYQQNFQQSKISRFSRSLKGSLQSVSQLQSSNISSSLSRMKKLTVVNGNSDIIVPRQKRFQIYQDKQSQFVSYLKNRNSFQLKQQHSGRFYKGASIGLGDKTDFAMRGSPGVGKYKLPSIWDRY